MAHLLLHASSRAYFLGSNFSPISFASSVKLQISQKDISLSSPSEEDLLARTLFIPCDALWRVLAALSDVSDYQESIKQEADEQSEATIPHSIIVIDNMDQIISGSCGGRSGTENVFIGKLQRSLERTSRNANCTILVS